MEVGAERVDIGSSGLVELESRGDSVVLDTWSFSASVDCVVAISLGSSVVATASSLPVEVRSRWRVIVLLPVGVVGGIVGGGGDSSDSSELSSSGGSSDDDDDEEEEEEEEEEELCASTRVVGSRLSPDITSDIVVVVTSFPTPVVVSS